MKRKKMLFISLLLLSASCGKDPVTPVETSPTISINSVTLFEGDNAVNFPFKVTLSKATDKDVTVFYTTKDKSAKAGVDYTSMSGTLVIPASATSATILISVLGDTIKQPDKDFEVDISNPVGATLGTDKGIGTIRNDDDYLIIPDDGYITPDSYAGYDKLWSDEFDGPSIDTALWGYDIGGSGWGNNELQYYSNSSSNSYISSSNLVIEAKEEDYGGMHYTSARLLTKYKKDFTFGRVDIRAILPKGQGIWPALWMLGSKIDQTGWPFCGEIDIMEVLGSTPSTVHGTIHFGPEGASQSTQLTSTYTLPLGDFSIEYHVFSLLWSQDNIEILVDDISYFKVDKTQVGDIYPFNEPFFMICNVAVGGNWPGPPDDTTVFPQQMIVDYVRVFKKQ